MTFPDIEALAAAALREMQAATTDAALEEVRRQYLGRKGQLHLLRSQIGKQPAEHRQAFGQAVNSSVTQVERALEERRAALAESVTAQRLVDDLFAPTAPAIG